MNIAGRRRLVIAREVQDFYGIAKIAAQHHVGGDFPGRGVHVVYDDRLRTSVKRVMALFETEIMRQLDFGFVIRVRAVGLDKEVIRRTDNSAFLGFGVRGFSGTGNPSENEKIGHSREDCNHVSIGGICL